MGLEYDKNVKSDKHYLRLFNKYALLGLNIFKWDNLPNGIESRHIEKALFECGQAVFYKDNTLGLVCLPSADGGRPNIYNESKTSIVNGYGGSRTKTILIDNSLETLYKENNIRSSLETGIRIINNDLMIPSVEYVRDYAEKMYEVELAIELNVKQQKFPYFIATNTKTEYTLKRMIRDIMQGKEAIFANKNFTLEDLKVFDLNVPYVVDRLNQYKFELEREILTFFGLNNNFEKKERLLVDEVNSNNDYISRNVELMYKCRIEACEEINKKYNLNITVSKVDLFHQIDKSDNTMIDNLRNPKGGGVSVIQNE